MAAERQQRARRSPGLRLRLRLRLMWLCVAESFWFALCAQTGGWCSRYYWRWEEADERLRAARRAAGVMLVALLAVGVGCSPSVVRPDPVITVRPCVVEAPAWPHLPVGDIFGAAGGATEAPLAAASFRLILGYAEALELALESCR